MNSGTFMLLFHKNKATYGLTEDIYFSEDRSIIGQAAIEEEFLKNCECVINNDGDLSKTKEEILKALNY